jgi:hypothetical protein
MERKGRAQLKIGFDRLGLIVQFATKATHVPQLNKSEHLSEVFPPKVPSESLAFHPV